MEGQHYLAIVEATGATLRVIPEKQRWQAMQIWREVYVLPAIGKAGKSPSEQTAWIWFAEKHTRAVGGERAFAAYSESPYESLFVVPANSKLPALELEGGNRPDFRLVTEGILVWPKGLDWTIAFSHDFPEFPYFSRRNWIQSP